MRGCTGLAASWVPVAWEKPNICSQEDWVHRFKSSRALQARFRADALPGLSRLGIGEGNESLKYGGLFLLRFHYSLPLSLCVFVLLKLA